VNKKFNLLIGLFVMLMLVCFSTKAEAATQPGGFSISKPVEDEIVVSDTKIKWGTSSGASYYTISVKNTDNNTYVTQLEKVYSTTYSLKYDELEPGAHYRIGVVAYASDGITSRNGGTVNFVAAPGEFEIYSPEDDAEITDDFKVKWSASEGADYYTISIKDLTDGSYVTQLKKVSKTSYSVSYSDLSATHDYRIGVVAYNSDGTGFRNGGTIEFKAVGDNTIVKGKYTSYNGDSYLLLSDKSKSVTISGSNVSTKAKALDVLKNNINTLVENGDYNFTSQQIACLQSITDKISDSSVTLDNMKKIIEFRFEGVGAYYGSGQTAADIVNYNANKNKIPSGYDIKGIFGAMSVIIQDGDITGVFFRTSTIPDDYLHYNTGVIADGWYNAVSWNHGKDDQIFAALQLRAFNNNSSQSIAAIYDNYDNVYYSEGINIHHDYGAATKRNSEGCLTVYFEDWPAYIKLYGYNNNTSYGYYWSHNVNGNTKLEKELGKIYIERCIDIVINNGTKTYSQYAKCNHLFESADVDMSKVENVFVDVYEGQWYVPFVQYVYDNNIMSGKGDNTFAPTKSITRAEFVQVLYNMDGKKSVKYSNVFSDVPQGKWFTNAVIWAYEKGIVSGYPNGQYGVGDQITREQMVVMIYKYAQLKGYSISADNNAINAFPDKNQVSDWAKKALNWAVSQEIMTGKNQLDGTTILDPKGYSTRAECATIISKVHKKMNE